MSNQIVLSGFFRQACKCFDRGKFAESAHLYGEITVTSRATNQSPQRRERHLFITVMV